MFARKGQSSGIFSIVFWIVIFLLLLGSGLGLFIINMSGLAITMGSLSGFEAFMIGNLILWIIIAFIIAALYWGGNR